MDSANLKGRTQGGGNTFDAGAKSGMSKLARAILRGALILAAIIGLVLITAGPAQGQTETIPYSFTGPPDGQWPEARLTFDGAGNLYGTTVVGGVWGGGTVFELRRTAAGAGTRPCSTASREGRTDRIRPTLT